MNVTSILVRDYEKKSPLLPKRNQEVHLEKNAQIFQDQRDLEQGIRERPSVNIQKDTSLLDVSKPLSQKELLIESTASQGHKKAVKILLKKKDLPIKKDLQKTTTPDHALAQKKSSPLPLTKNHKHRSKKAPHKKTSHSQTLWKKFANIISILVKDYEDASLFLPKRTREVYSKKIARTVRAQRNLEQIIREKKSSSIRKNCRLIDVNTSLFNKELPIHFAVREGNKKAVEVLLKKKANPMKKDFQGLTAVDHAFLQKKSSLLSLLVKKTEMENLQKIAQQQDPLRVPLSHYLFFSTNIIIFLIIKTLTIKNQNQKKIKQLSKDLDWFKIFSSVFVQFENWDNPSKMSNVVLGNAFFSNQEVLSTLFSTWKTYDLGKIMFRGLKASYNNIRYRPFKATWNALIYTANLGFLLQNTREIFQDTREIFGKFQASYAEFKTELHQHSDCIDGICPEHYFEINKAIQDLSILERLEYKDLNPIVPFCALKIIDPTFTMQQLQQQGKKLYTKPYHKLQLKMHPDKKAQNSNKKAQSNESNAASAQLNTAKETLDQWVEKNTVKQEL